MAAIKLLVRRLSNPPVKAVRGGDTGMARSIKQPCFWWCATEERREGAGGIGRDARQTQQRARDIPDFSCGYGDGDDMYTHPARRGIMMDNDRLEA